MRLSNFPDYILTYLFTCALMDLLDKISPFLEKPKEILNT